MLTVIISLLISALYDILKASVIKSHISKYFFDNKKVTDFGILIISSIAIAVINIIEIIIIIKADKEIRELIRICSVFVIVFQACFMVLFDRYMKLKKVNKKSEKQSVEHD